MYVKNNNKSYIFAGLTVFLWSTVATAFKYGLKYLEPSILLLYSSFFSFLFFLILINLKFAKSVSYSKDNLAKSALAGFINPFLYYLILFESYKLLPAQIAQPLNYTWVIIVTVLMSVFIEKKFVLSNFAGILISFVGVVILSTQGKIDGIGEISIFGIILALSSSLFWGIYWLINIKDRRSDIEKLFLNFMFGTLFIFIYVVVTTKFVISIEGILTGIYIGLFEMGLTFYLWMKALQYSTNTSKTGNIIYLTPFISMIFIWLILKEPLSINSIFGLIFIIAGILYTSYKKASK